MKARVKELLATKVKARQAVAIVVAAILVAGGVYQVRETKGVALLQLGARMRVLKMPDHDTWQIAGARPVEACGSQVLWLVNYDSNGDGNSDQALLFGSDNAKRPFVSAPRNGEHGMFPSMLIVDYDRDGRVDEVFPWEEVQLNESHCAFLKLTAWTKKTSL